MSDAQDIIKDTKPLNLVEERAKFFANPAYNPQFQYSRTILPSELSVWGLPKESLYLHAQSMLSYWNKEGKTQSSTPVSPLATEEFIQDKVAQFNQTYQLESPIIVQLLENTIPRCHLAGRTLKLHSQLQYTQAKFEDLLRHELETHYLRRLNHQLQGWEQFPDPIFRRTEEGLANLHTFLFREEKFIYKTYRTYFAAYLAQHSSFAEVFAQLLTLDVPEDIAFLLCLRTKRGLEDTSQPGGLTKDACYFEGSIQVWQWLMNPNHDPRDLYLGRISLDQISDLKPQAKQTGLLYPTFFNDLEMYRANIKAIGERNHFEQLLAHLVHREDMYANTSA